MAQRKDAPSRLSVVWSRLSVVWLNASFWSLFAAASILFLVLAVPYVYLFDLLGRNRRRTLWLVRRTISHYGGAAFYCGWPLVRVRFIDYAPQEKPPFVFVANHRSSSDAFLMAVLRYEVIQILNIWPSRLPFVNCFSRLAGYLRVREMPFEQFIEAGSKLLAEGVSIIAFPEGTRSGSCELGQFHGSAFRLAQHVGAKICPLTISGNEHIPSRGSLVMHPGRIVISKLPSLTCEQYKELNAYRLKTRVREMIRKNLDAQTV
ncbi:MAG: lysophospholipid acyltransferase family protein [Tepidisphaeraceae bacterium]